MDKNRKNLPAVEHVVLGVLELHESVELMSFLEMKVDAVPNYRVDQKIVQHLDQLFLFEMDVIFIISIVIRKGLNLF